MSASYRESIDIQGMKRGVTLLLVILVLSAVLSISIGIFSLVYGEIRISGEITDSFVALYAADSGMEKLAYETVAHDNILPGVSGSSDFSFPNPIPYTNTHACITALLVSRTGPAVSFASVASNNRQDCAGPQAVGVVRSFSAFFTKNTSEGFLTPIAAWPFDEGSGAIASDLIVNPSDNSTEPGTLGIYNNSGFVNNSVPTWKQLVGSNYDLRFDGGVGDGQGDGVTVQNHQRLDNLTAMTISAWIFPRTGANAGQFLAEKFIPGPPNRGFRLQINPDSNNSLRFVRGFSTADLVQNSDPAMSPLRPGQWQYIAVTWNGSNKSASVKIYICSVSNACNEAGGYIGSANAAGSTNLDSSEPLYIGNSDSANPSRNRGFDGCIDTVRIWDKELTSEQITGDYAFFKNVYSAATCN